MKWKFTKKLKPQKIYIYDIDRNSPGEGVDFRINRNDLFSLAKHIFMETEIEVIALSSSIGRGTHELSEINTALIQNVEVKNEAIAKNYE